MVTVETLDKLERRITLTLAAEPLHNEVAARLKKLARTVKADGFRPGKVPMSVVTQRYGYSVHYEVMNDQVGEAFSNAVKQAQLKVVGPPRIAEKNDASLQGQLAFDAIFEVYPEVVIGDLGTIEIDFISSAVTESAIDKTIDVLRKQRRTFHQRAATEGAVEGDRVTIDFEGKIDGVSFDGGKAEGFQFLIGEGQMLAAFDKAVRGMKSGDSKTFPIQFPQDYQGKDVAGKEADFLVTLHKLEAQQLPPIDDDFAKSLGTSSATVEALRQDVKQHLEREVKSRVQARNQANVMGALVKNAQLDLPKALVSVEVERMVADARVDLKNRGIQNAETTPIPTEVFMPQAEHRVRLGLVVGELVRANNLNAKPEQLQAKLEELAQSYERPGEVISYYLGDQQRMAEIAALVIENNVADFVLQYAKVEHKELSFDELMTA